VPGGRTVPLDKRVPRTDLSRGPGERVRGSEGLVATRRCLLPIRSGNGPPIRRTGPPR
jgi:hypothetical protein